MGDERLGGRWNDYYTDATELGCKGRRAFGIGDSNCFRSVLRTQIVVVLNRTDYDGSNWYKRRFPEREAIMFYPLDIFKTDSDGSVLWQGAAETLIAAKLRIQRLALSSPGEYMVKDQHTGDSVRIRPDVSSLVGD
jgi:hypothetical protein